jgi:hypothetical protein
MPVMADEAIEGLDTLAELHVAAVSGNVLDGCECVGPTKLTGDVVTDPVIMESGTTAVRMKKTIDNRPLESYGPAHFK